MKTKSTAEEEQSTVYTVYRIRNKQHDRKYIGVTKRGYKRRISEQVEEKPESKQG